MAVWRKIKALVDHVLGEDERAGNLREDELRLAAAALLIHASMIDGHVDPEETKTLKSLLQSRFAIDDDELRKTLKEAEAWEHDAVDLYRFTSVLCRGLDQDGRQRIVEMLWEIVLADGVLHEFEFEPGVARLRIARRLDPRPRAIEKARRESGSSSRGLYPPSSPRCSCWLGVAKQYTKTTVNMLATRIGANAGRTTRFRSRREVR